MATPVEILAAVAPSAGTAKTFTFTGGAAIGDAVAVFFFQDDSGTLPTTLSDSAGNTYTPQGVGDASWTTGHMRAYFCASLTATIVANTTTITYTNAQSNNKGAFAYRVTSVTTVSADKTNRNVSQTTATPTTGTTGTLAQASELAFAFYGYVSNPAFTVPTGYSQTATTRLTTTGGAESMSVCYKDVGATTAQNPQATIGASGSCAGAIFTMAYTTASGPVNITPTSSITAGVTSVTGSVSKGIVPIVSSTISVTVAVSNRAPDVLFSVSVFGAVGIAPDVPIVPGSSTITITVSGGVTILGKAGAGYSSRRTEGFAHVIGFPR